MIEYLSQSVSDSISFLDRKVRPENWTAAPLPRIDRLSVGEDSCAIAIELLKGVAAYEDRKVRSLLLRKVAFRRREEERTCSSVLVTIDEFSLREHHRPILDQR